MRHTCRFRKRNPTGVIPGVIAERFGAHLELRSELPWCLVVARSREVNLFRAEIGDPAITRSVKCGRGCRLVSSRGREASMPQRLRVSRGRWHAESGCGSIVWPTTRSASTIATRELFRE